MLFICYFGFPGSSVGKESVCSAGDLGSSPWEDPLEEGMATQSTIPVRKIPMDRGAWQATGHGVTESQTRLGSQAQHTLLLVTATLIGPTGLVWPQHWVLIGWAKT